MERQERERERERKREKERGAARGGSKAKIIKPWSNIDYNTKSTLHKNSSSF